MSVSRSEENSAKARTFICAYDDCDKKYTCAAHLKRHEETHIGNFQCSEKNCGKIFKTKATLKKHVDNIHLKKHPKKYKCPRCDEEFNKACWLRRHEFKHTGVKPYMCPEDGCEKRFLFPSKLKMHLKVHEGYTCTKENCGKTFSKWTLYTKHLKLSHPKIHKCHYCEREFSRSNNFKSHMEMHKLDRNVFPCPKPDCSRFYFMKRNLTYHIKSYHEKRPFVCPQEHCHRAFKSEADMNVHLSWHDPYKRIRRKKKKGNPRPSFAEKLAGFAPKKWQLNPVSEQNIEQEIDKEYSAESDKSEDTLLVSSSEKSEDLEMISAENSEVEMETTSEESEDEPQINNYQENQNESQLNRDSDNVSSQTCQDVKSLTTIENNIVDCNIDDGIQTLLNTIEEKNECSIQIIVEKTK